MWTWHRVPFRLSDPGLPCCFYPIPVPLSWTLLTRLFTLSALFHEYNQSIVTSTIVMFCTASTDVEKAHKNMSKSAVVTLYLSNSTKVLAKRLYLKLKVFPKQVVMRVKKKNHVAYKFTLTRFGKSRKKNGEATFYGEQL